MTMTANAAQAGEIAHSRVGAGPAVLLVHCLGGDRNEWRDVSARLAKSHTVIAVDLPGHGATPAVAKPSLDAIADDLAALLRAEKATPAIVIGHSLGAGVAAHLAERHAEMVKGLVVVDMGIGTTFTAAGAAELNQKLAANRDAVVPRWFGSMMKPGNMERLEPTLDKTATTTLMGYVDALAHGALGDGGKALTMPVLLMATKELLPGKQPRATELADAGFAHAPRLTVEVFPEAQHWILWDEPARFEDVLETWMARVAGASVAK
ncbi:MAG TPA: alpha/beta fold hydrolase [Polyangia bacterium]|nr:alpha/beta fold hydrolase [Polyangia bacterium]